MRLSKTIPIGISHLPLGKTTGESLPRKQGKRNFVRYCSQFLSDNQCFVSNRLHKFHRINLLVSHRSHETCEILSFVREHSDAYALQLEAPHCLPASIRANGGEHTRVWSPPFARMLAINNNGTQREIREKTYAQTCSDTELLSEYKALDFAITI